jgi:hypothetical protein
MRQIKYRLNSNKLWLFINRCQRFVEDKDAAFWTSHNFISYITLENDIELKMKLCND